MNTIRHCPIFLSVTYLLFSVGCASPGPRLDVNKMMADYYAQERSYNAVKLTGASSITITGNDMDLVLEAPHNPLSMRASDPNVALETIATVGRVAVAGAGIYTAGKVMNTMAQQPRTVDPIIVDRPVPWIAPASESGSFP